MKKLIVIMASFFIGAMGGLWASDSDDESPLVAPQIGYPASWFYAEDKIQAIDQLHGEILLFLWAEGVFAALDKKGEVRFEADGYLTRVYFRIQMSSYRELLLAAVFRLFSRPDNPAVSEEVGSNIQNFIISSGGERLCFSKDYFRWYVRAGDAFCAVLDKNKRDVTWFKEPLRSMIYSFHECGRVSTLPVEIAALLSNPGYTLRLDTQIIIAESIQCLDGGMDALAAVNQGVARDLCLLQVRHDLDASCYDAMSAIGSGNLFTYNAPGVPDA